MTSPVLPERRLDHLITDAGTGQIRRSTEYSGVVWIGGRPPTGGIFFGRSVSASKPRVASVFVPDSLPYLDAEAAVVTHTWISSGPGDPNPFIVGARAELVADPRDPRLYWVQLTVRVAGSVPAGIGYRIVVEADPGMISR
ncbi:hypothetical protein ACIG56_09935 [Nocardia fusca]|uniref:hypothetical protein n=1 Tax=Nocardia fusca TaxID=941183 RepID=UPI0037C60A4A